jgi:hypothetical protein
MFKGWPRSRLERLCHLVERKVYPPGQVIVRQDDPSDCVYFIIEGRCGVSVASRGPVRDLRVVGMWMIELLPLQVYKEITTAIENRWPNAMDGWEEQVCRTCHSSRL